jgi:CO/xanthine dehydrogenase FAD-binding subunit
VLPLFELLQPDTIDEALSILIGKGMACKIFAGGTDLFIKMHGSFESPEYLLDIKRLDELKSFEETPDGGFVIGALTNHFRISRDPILVKRYTALAEAAEKVGSLQIRHRGTIGGNICNAVPSGDTLGPLLAFDAVCSVIGQNGERCLPIEAFFTGPGCTALETDEILKEIILPPCGGGAGSAYIKFTRRNAMDLALLGASAVLRFGADACFDHVRISLTTAGPTPMRAKETEAYLIGKKPDNSVIAEAGRIASLEAKPRGSWRSPEEYRRDILRTIVPEVIKKAIGDRM